MIQINETAVNGLPLLEIVEEDKKEKQLPTVIFYHGWTSCKESVIVNGYELAKKGFRALLPDAHLHGRRTNGKPVQEQSLEFWNVVGHSVKEAAVIRNHYIQQGLSDQEKFGVSGLSMGGITTSAMLTQYEWIKAAVVLMGSPSPVEFSHWLLSSPWAEDKLSDLSDVLPKEAVSAAVSQLKPISLNLHPERIAGRPLLFWHGTEDDLVPYEPTYQFYQAIKDKPYAKEVSFSTGKGVGHKVPYAVSLEMAEYFKRHL